MVEKDMYDFVQDVRKLYPEFNTIKDKHIIYLNFKFIWMKLCGKIIGHAGINILFNGMEIIMYAISHKATTPQLGVREKYTAVREYIIYLRDGHDFITYTSNNIEDIKKCLGI